MTQCKTFGSLTNWSVQETPNKGAEQARVKNLGHQNISLKTRTRARRKGKEEAGEGRESKIHKGGEQAAVKTAYLFKLDSRSAAQREYIYRCIFSMPYHVMYHLFNVKHLLCPTYKSYATNPNCPYHYHCQQYVDRDYCPH